MTGDQPTGPTSELENLRRQLVQSQKMSCLGILATSIAHEFNNYLTTIINYAKLGKRETDPERLAKSFEKIYTAGTRAAEITQGMLGFARGDSVEPKPTDMVQLVQEALQLVEKDFSKHRVQLETRFEDKPFASVAAAQIQQIVLNLLINARQALVHGGHVQVFVGQDAESETVKISVADTGEGIPEQRLKNIFDPFYTTKEGPDDTGKGGTGIGLAVCRDIVKAHHGRIRVESILGRGTTFTILLPAVDPPVERQAVA